MAASSLTNGEFFGSSPGDGDGDGAAGDGIGVAMGADEDEDDAKDAAAAAGAAGEAGAADTNKFPKILLMGLRRSGKSSIQKVVFHKMSPNETLFLESTNHIVKDQVNNSSFVQFAIWDFPGQIDFFDPTFEAEKVFDRCGAIIYVIDAQDDYTEAMQKLSQTVQKAYETKPDIKIEVFIHKVDGLSDETKMDTQREICRHWADDCIESGLDGKVQLSFYLTSIYDHSIFEAFSKVVQKLIPEMSTLEGLLNLFASNCCGEKVFLFDVLSKIYVATDSSPVDIQSYELCCDMIDVVVDVSCIYGYEPETSSIAFDNRSSSTIVLDNGTVLFLREVSNVLAMVCIIREDNWMRMNRGLVDYNFTVIRTAINKTFEVRRLAELEEEEAAAKRAAQEAAASAAAAAAATVAV